ncbi:MAG: phosphoribosylanthranilate isomerase [Bacteroidetes bacterium]|nr:phosphoribosylanthranilate isomerase [Bacteroidota bacterium]
MTIKICGIKNKCNLDEIASCSPDLLGFIFYKKSQRYMADNLIPSDLQNLPAKKIGVFVDSSFEEIEKITSEYKLDGIQFHGNESVALCKNFLKQNLILIKAFSIDDQFDFTKTKDYSFCDYFLFDTKGENRGGNGKTFNWGILKKYDQKVPFFLSGGIGPENISETFQLEGLNLVGVDLNSRLEVSPGIKDINKVKNIISLIRQHTL